MLYVFTLYIICLFCFDVYLIRTVCKYCMYMLLEDPREDRTLSYWTFSLNKVIIIIINELNMLIKIKFWSSVYLIIHGPFLYKEMIMVPYGTRSQTLRYLKQNDASLS